MPETLRDNRRTLEDALAFYERSESLRTTVLGVYDTLVAIRKSFHHPSRPRKPDGMLVYTNYRPWVYVNNGELPPLNLFVWPDELSRVQLTEKHSVHTPAGRNLLDRLLYHNGAIEVDAESGRIARHQVKIDFARGFDAISSTKAGFNLAERRRTSGSEYRGIGTRHWTAYFATAFDPNMYTLLLSRETEVINIFKWGRILKSSLPEEIDPIFLPPFEEKYREPEQLKLPF